MTAHTFWTKLCNLILIAVVLLGYNSVLHSRTQNETIAQLESELAQQELNAAAQVTEEEQTAAETETTTEAVVETGYADGVYQGEATGYGGSIVVEVTITDGVLTDLEILSADQEDGAYLEAASGVVAEILETQSTEVDTISGATFSSNGIIQAAADAIRKAETP